MRNALLAGFLVATSVACTSTPRSASRELVERQVNQRLDKQLHTTLQKLLGNQTAQAGTSASAAGLLTRR